MEVLDRTRTKERQLMTHFAGVMLDRGMTLSEVRDKTKRLLRHYRNASLRNAIVYSQDDRVESHPIFRSVQETTHRKNTNPWEVSRRVFSLVARDIISSIQFLSTPHPDSAIIRVSWFFGGIAGAYALGQSGGDNNLGGIARTIGVGLFGGIATLATVTGVAARVRRKINSPNRGDFLNA